jgi:hypothetical protein
MKSTSFKPLVPSSYTVTFQTSRGWIGSPENTLFVEGPSTPEQTLKLASAFIPKLLQYIKPLGSELCNIGGMTTTGEPQVICRITTKEGDTAGLNARFLRMSSREIFYSLESLADAILSPKDTENSLIFFQQLLCKPIQDITAGLSWYKPSGFALFATEAPVLSEYFEFSCNISTLSLRLSSAEKGTADDIPGPKKFSEIFSQLLAMSHDFSLFDAFQTALKK